MSACLAIGATVLLLAGPEFSLDWQHSVEKIRWREDWRIEGDHLRLTSAAVQGSGAGMEPGADARLTDGWWIWLPDLAPMPQLTLATSGATAGGWRLCDQATCHDIAETGAPLVLRPCSEAEWREAAKR